MAKDRGKEVEMTERDPAPIPIDPREDSGQATPAAIHSIEDAPEPGENKDQVVLVTLERSDINQPAQSAVAPVFGSAPVADLTSTKKKSGVKINDDVEYCVGYRNAGVDKDGNSVREPVYTSAKVLELDEDHREGHIKLSYVGENGQNFPAWAHHFAGRPGYWQFAGEKPAKDDEE